jgi:hypothetical protein
MSFRGDGGIKEKRLRGESDFFTLQALERPLQIPFTNTITRSSDFVKNVDMHLDISLLAGACAILY